MHVLVLLKWIPSPDISAAFLKLDGEQAQVADSVPRVVGPFDKVALELALRLRDQDRATQLQALTIGAPAAVEALRLAMAHGVEETMRVEAPNLGPDTVTGARLLVSALPHLSHAPDVILVGDQSGEWDQGVFGAVVASMLDVPYISRVSALLWADDRLRFRRDEGDRVVEGAVRVPVVVSATLAADTTLRFPVLKNVLAAKRKTPPVVAVNTPSGLRVIGLHSISPPARVSTWVEGTLDTQIAAVREQLRNWGMDA